jgi:hypothetical protein
MCVAWARARAVTNYKFRLLFAIPNGGARNAITGALLKAEGVTPGVPDLFLAQLSGGFGGLFVEMKRLGGKCSDAQLDMHEDLRASGYAVEVVDDFEGFKRAVLGYLGADR